MAKLKPKELFANHLTEGIANNEVLSAITDDAIIAAIKKIATTANGLSVDQANGDHWQNMDDLIHEITGVERGSRQTTTYLKEELVKKGSVDPFESKYTALNKKYADLEKQLKDGKLSDAAKSQIDNLTSELTTQKDAIKQWKKKVEDMTGAHETALEALRKENMETSKSSALAAAIATFNFKDDKVVSERHRKLEIKDAKQNFSELYTMDNVMVDGKKRVVWKNADGEIMRDKGTLEPSNAAELMRPLLTEVLADGKVKTGAGTSKSKVKTSVNGWTNQVEANEGIANIAINEGHKYGSQSYGDRVTELAVEHNIVELPVMSE